MLFVSFQSGHCAPIEKHDLARFWSLEMHWLDPDEANILLGKLLDLGWLAGNDSSLSLNPRVTLSPPELGWQPLLRNFDDIPVAPEWPIEDPSTHLDTPESPLSHDLQVEGGEGAAELDGEGALTRHISMASGLDRREVVRRANRKCRALAPISMRLALALVAREQHLEMPEVVEIMGR